MFLLLTVTAVIIVSVGASFWAFTHVMGAETYVRYAGLQKIISEKTAKTILGIETNAKHVFDEVGRNLDSPEAVIATLDRKTSLGPEVRGYFAAFVPEYFPEKGRWFEPYVHHVDSSEFVLDMVGSARHDYTMSDWYIRGKDAKEGFWCDPYEYIDGTSMNGLYSSYIEPIFDGNGKQACVCGADITFEWLTKELQKIDELFRNDESLNRFRLMRDLDFFSMVIDKDGSCIAYPDGKKLTIKDEGMLKDMQQKKSGTLDMTVGGIASTLYYGPIDGMNWSLAVVTPKDDVQKPTLTMGLVLLVIAVLGIIITWIICRRISYAKEN